jgi:uncharacterized damage-inducible protein DinB
MHTLLLHQYQLVLGARGALLTYCEQLNANQLLQPIPGFNNSSIQSLMVHVANTYIYWLVNVGQQNQRPYFKETNIKDITALRQMFEQVDNAVNDFLMLFKDHMEIPAAHKLPNKDVMLTLTPLQLFTHAFTHEFHHKGQILNMGRQLGYIPADTDVIRS